MRWNFEGVSVFAPFCVASHFLLRKAAAYFCWFCCRMCRNRQRGLNFGPIPCDWCPWAVASETLFYIKFHMYTLLYNFLFKSLSSSVWQRQTAVWLCGISRKRSDRRICSERIKSSQSLNSLCITVRQAEMLSLSLSKLHGRRARAIITWSTQFAWITCFFYGVCERVAEWNYPRRRVKKRVDGVFHLFSDTGGSKVT